MIYNQLSRRSWFRHIDNLCVDCLIMKN